MMISENQIEKLCEKLVDRIEQANLVFLEEIGKSIKQLGALTPTKAQQLINILKYGSNYDDIVYKISQITNLNVKEIDKIFHAYAEKDRLFYQRFYEYRNLLFSPYQENNALRMQVQALANITKNELSNFMNTRALGYSIKNLNGNVVFTGLRETYNRVLDEAILNIGQGKQSFDEAMRDTLKQLGGSGLKTVDYKGRSMRLDSAVRMNMQGALRNLHNEMQQIYGQEFNSDGVEISVHSNPAPDHAEVQGRQFSNEEFNKFQNDIDAVDYKGKIFTAEFDGKDRRAISEYNCYHYIFSIILGVSQPQYNDKQLQKIIDENNKKINIDGKEYTKYECTQLQRRFETAIRKQKDTQILAKASGNDDLILESQQNITQLTNKYREISKKAGLPTREERLRVSGYRRTKVTNYIDFDPKTMKDLEQIGKKYFNFESNEYLDQYVTTTSNIKNRIQNGDTKLKETLNIIEPEIDKLSRFSPIDFKLYSAKDINVDYSKDNHLLSATISKSVANIHNNKKINKETITINVEKGAKIISTYNTKNRQFNRQGEIILPANKKLERIDEYTYLLRK